MLHLCDIGEESILEWYRWVHEQFRKLFFRILNQNSKF